MKFKTILIFVSIILSIFIIYKINIDKKVYYVDINGTTYENETYDQYIVRYLKTQEKLEKYINSFTTTDYRITDLIRDIETNKVITINGKEQTLQNALIKADLLTIKLGDNELNYKINTTEINELFDYCDTLITDIESLFLLLRKYCKEEIYFLGLYNTNSDYYSEIYDYLNLKIADLSEQYDIKFIDTGDLLDENENIRVSEKIIENSSL